MFAARRVLHPPLINADRFVYVRFFGAEHAKLRLGRLDALLKLQHVGIRHARRLRGRLDGIRDVFLQSRDLVSEVHDVGILVAVTAPEIRELVGEPGDLFRSGVGALRVGVHVDELALENRLLLAHPDLLLAAEHELGVQPLEGRQICIALLGELAQVTFLELAHLDLLRVDLLLDLVELAPQELRGAAGLALPGSKIFLNEIGRQRIGHGGGRVGIAGTVADGERDRGGIWAPLLRSFHVDRDVSAHTLDEVFRR